MEKCNYRKDPHQDIDHVFRDLLPAHGMVERPAQVELSHQMLDTMLNGSIALCDAGTGIGKTYITQNCRQGLDVHSVGLGVGCKSMARTMKSHPFTSRIIQNSVQALMGRGWTHGQVFFLWGWKHPS